MREPRNYEAPLCAEVDGDLWFPERGTNLADIRAAQRICASCIHQSECAKWGMENEEFGIWGGLTAFDREQIRKQRKLTLGKKQSA